jgi:class 3 adenylate cyclase
MLSPKTKSNISRIIPFGVIWLLFSLVYTYLEKGFLGELNYYPATTNAYSFAQNLFFIPVFALIAGLLIGTFEVLYLNKRLLNMSFTSKIVSKVIIYLALIVAFLVCLTVITTAIELQSSIFDKTVWASAKAFFSSNSFLSVSAFMAVAILISQFYNEVSENIGQVVLTNFLTGKYHRPTEEERIFMFLDMKSSTTIAEKLGHAKYFEVLKECFADLSDPIVDFSGEIYQYAGDEIVISWTLRKGVLNNNCIECFFAMKQALRNSIKKYHERFGLLPAFKAGLHFGKVTTGEIGVIKKEIIFSGDVLNTTARIQGLCNTYNVDLLLSGNLIQLLHPDPRFEVKSVGVNVLRGRDESMELFTIALQGASTGSA